MGIIKIFKSQSLAEITKYKKYVYFRVIVGCRGKWKWIEKKIKEDKRLFFVIYQLDDSSSMSAGLFKISKFKIIHFSTVCISYEIINYRHAH